MSKIDLFDLFAKISLDTSEFERGVSNAVKSSKAIEQSVSGLSSPYEKAKKKVADLSDEFSKSAKETGIVADGTEKLTDKIEDAGERASSAENELDDYSGSVKKSGEQADEAETRTQKFANALKKGVVEAAKLAGEALKVTFAAMSVAAVGVGKILQSSITSYGEYEQLVGGVETLFSNLDGTISAAPEVLKNAENAYKTAGMSANQYMETVTSFSAALVSSLEGDYSKAAKISDMAITDMSDNANKMGTSMESIQNAYQGFAKQNYTMLDNLKLGYGGTKSEMERLLADAEKFSGVKYDIDNLSDVYEAIHVVQTELGITGTTAEEASSTLQGSTGQMKAAWENLVTGFADENADLGQLIDNLVESAKGMFKNLVPIASRALKGIGKAIKEVAPIISKELPGIVNDVLPDLLSAATDLVVALANALPSIIQVLVEQAPIIIDSIVGAIVELLPQLIELGMQMIVTLALGIAESLPELIPTIVEVMLQIVETLIENIDMLVDAAIQIIIALAEGLINALPVLIEKAPEIIRKLVEAIIENVPKLLTAAWEIIQMLAQGIVDNLTTMVDKGKEMVNKIIDGIKQKFLSLVTKGKEIIDEVKNGVKQKIEDAKQWGKDLIKNFISGITAKWESLKQTVRNVAKSVKSFLGFSEPEEGPLSDFHTYAPDMMDLFIKGIRDNESKLRNQIAKTFDVEPYFKPDYSLGTTAGSSTSGSSQIVAVLTEMFPEMIQAIKDMRLYLDGDTLVGGIVDPMDEGLGRKSIYRARAN